METVSFEIAKKLKEKGFTLPKSNVVGEFDSDGVFHSQLYINFTETMDSEEIIAPTISQVLKWLRDEKKIYVSVEVEREDWFEYKIVQTIKNTRKTGIRVYETYLEAILAGIEYVIDNLI